MEKLRLQKLKELDEAIFKCKRAAEDVQAAKEAMAKLDPRLTKEFAKIHEIIKESRRRIQCYHEIMAVELPPPDTGIGCVAANIRKLEVQLKKFQVRYRTLRNKLPREFKKINEFKTDLQETRNITEQATEVEVIEHVTVQWPKWWTSKTVEGSQSLHADWRELDLGKKILEYFKEIDKDYNVLNDCKITTLDDDHTTYVI